MQYYELYSSLPKKLQGIVDEMPRQAIYSLSSRSIPQEKKVAFVKEYQGESKTELLEKLRNNYPLDQKDKRSPNKAPSVMQALQRVIKAVHSERFIPTDGERAEIASLLKKIEELIQ